MMVKEKIRISKEKRDRQYIKEELMRYYMYKDKITELKAEIRAFKKKYQEILNDPPIGGSVIKMPDGTPNNQNLVMRLECKLNDMETNLKYYQKRLHELNNWLSALTKEQYPVIIKYVCEYQCQDRWHAAVELKCDSENVKKATERAIERIRKKFDKIF